MSTTENTSTIASLHCAQAAAAQAAASWYRNFQTAQEGNQEAEVVRFFTVSLHLLSLHVLTTAAVKNRCWLKFTECDGQRARVEQKIETVERYGGRGA
jgi:hypothetical protein